MKGLLRTTTVMALAGAAFFVMNTASALAGPPLPWEVDPAHDLIDPHIPLDPGPAMEPLLPSICETSGICGEFRPIDPCIIFGTCDSEDGDPEAVDPTATPTDEPTPTPTDEPTATATDEPTASPTDEPTVAPTSTPSVVPGDLPPAGSDGGLMNDVGSGVVMLASMSLGAMGLAWMLFFASRRRASADR